MKKAFQWSVLMVFIFLCACKNDKSTKELKHQKPLTFNFQPKNPVNGVLKGVIELGASGFNSFIVEVDKDANYKVKRKEFGSSLFIEGMTNASEVNDKFKEYVKKMIEFGVSTKNIHFVMSSGAKMSEIAKLVTPKLKSLGYNIYEVNPEEEGIYALKSVLPQQFKDKAFVVDIGSGNTKISYFQGDSIIVKETYGSKYFQKSIPDTEVYKNVKSIAELIPKQNKEICFILGGVPYHMATNLRKGDERFTILATEIKEYTALVKDKGKKVESGLNIFKAIADETGCKKYIFDWDANFTIGFLLENHTKK